MKKERHPSYDGGGADLGNASEFERDMNTHVAVLDTFNAVLTALVNLSVLDANRVRQPQLYVFNVLDRRLLGGMD